MAVPPDRGRDYSLEPWQPSWTPAGHRADVERVRDHIAAGDIFQGNLTGRLRSRVSGDLTQLYADLVHNQRTRFGAWLETGSHVLASASPELFFEWSGDRLLTRPMKGTAARGRTTAEDEQVVAALAASTKERAENIIVVDLLRNDVSRVADVGSVAAPVLCRPERYETVWQLTSDVVGTVPASTPLVDVFRALFPCGSVTGAPKPRAMEIIRDVETSPRGVYCGTIGWVAPPGEPVRARFSVAIRTSVVDCSDGTVTYGTGGGITWASDPVAELAELDTKAAILHRPYREVQLIETLAYVDGALRHLDRHLRRLASSAAYFGYPFDEQRVRRELSDVAAGQDAARVRLTLDRRGRTGAELAPLPAAPTRPVALAVSDEPVDSTSRWLFHKTTNRDVYDSRARRHPDADDVVLVNERGEATETTIANLAVLLGGVWYTPPVECGLLAGVERGRLVERGVLRERVLGVEDLGRAQALALVSSVRGWRTAVVRAPAGTRRRGSREKNDTRS